jgi:hypothetical protein
MMYWKHVEGNSHDLTEVLPWYLLGGTEKGHEQPKPGQWVSLQTEHILNMSHEHYCHANAFRNKV